MIRLTPLAACLLLGACASTSTTSFESDLPGVAAEETTFFSGTVRNVYRGDNDVIFVNAAGKWFRTVLNEGCLASVASQTPTFVFDSQGTSRVDRFTRVDVIDGSSMPYRCQIQSIRESMAPPMVDSASVVPKG